MNLKTLYDSRRRREILGDIGKGKLTLRKRKPGAQAASQPLANEDVAVSTGRNLPSLLPLTEEQVRKRMEELERQVEAPNASPDEADGPGNMLEQAKKIKAGLENSAFAFQMELLAAGIRTGRLEQVKSAHQAGADLNGDISSAQHSTRPLQGAAARPMELALAVGNQDIINYLKKHGAR